MAVNNQCKNVVALIPAAGVGKRMGGDVPKQYLKLIGHTILQETIGVLSRHPDVGRILVGVSKADHYFEHLDVPMEITVQSYIGGAERCDTVSRGLEILMSDGLGESMVVIHDAVRPLITHGELDKVLEVAGKHGDGAVLGVPVNDTVKRVDEHGRITETPSRSGLWRAFTPQCFQVSVLYEVYKTLLASETAEVSLTDDASVMERAGGRPMMVAGCADNIKITSPEDLEHARQILIRRGQHR